jgi:hypothetical protein
MPPMRMMPAAKMSASCHVSRPPLPVVLPSVVEGPEFTVTFGVGGAPRVGACCPDAGAASARTSAGTAISHPTLARIAAECSPRDTAAGAAAARGTLTDAMPPKPRQIKVEQRSALAAMQQLETRSDEELQREQKFKAAAQAILGARAAERYDADAARAHFRRAIAAARPQERMQLRRMADASLALAERRPDDLKEAVTRLGQAPPSNRQLMMLRLMGLIAPPQNAPWYMKLRGVLLIVLLVVVLLAVGFGIVKLIALPFGGTGTGGALLLGLLLVVAVLGVLILVGRRRQQKARDAARANQRAG